jgi:hypothetical protein
VRLSRDIAEAVNLSLPVLNFTILRDRALRIIYSRHKSDNMRCEFCSDLTIKALREQYNVHPQHSFKSLKSSADNGCDLCNLVYTGFMSRHSKALINQLLLGRNPFTKDNDTRIRFHAIMNDRGRWEDARHRGESVSVYAGKTWGSQRNISLSLYAIDGTELSEYISGRPIAPSSGSVEALSRAQQWLKNCDKKHERCRACTEPSILPTRLVDISGKPRVVQVADHQKGRYIALSYCWGTSGKNLLLTASSFHRFISDGIEFEDLVKTIQDAIKVARHFGVNYIWIDALCIIQQQPDLEDIRREAPRMAEYFSNAYLTFVIRAVSDCSLGFLDRRPTPYHPPCEIKHKRPKKPGEVESTSSEVIKTSAFLAPRASKEIGCISARAWTYRELLLSSRCLIFGEEQLKFQCLSIGCFEDGDFTPFADLDGDLVAPGVYYSSPNVTEVLKNAPSIGAAKIQDYLLNKWYWSILEVSMRDMSDVLDKLATLAGLAGLFQSVLERKYMYGLWEMDLPVGLLWRARHAPPYHPSLVTRDSSRAPSWSWASINGEVEMPSIWRDVLELETSGFSVISHTNISGALDPIRENREVPRAFELLVKGFLLPVWHVPILINVEAGFPVVDEVFLTDQKPYTVQSTWEHEHVGYRIWDTSDDYESRKWVGVQVYALLLTSSEALLLEAMEAEAGLLYRRIGIMSRIYGKEAKSRFRNLPHTVISLI